MVGAIIQARLSSSRLPNKVLKKLPFGSETSVIENVYQRVRSVKEINKTIVATSDEVSDDPLVDYCMKKGIPVFRGPLNNVLERFYSCSKLNSFNSIVRITGDCPAIDPQLISLVINEFENSNFDFVSSTISRTYPYGQDLSVFSFSSLEKAYKNATLERDFEHVTSYFYKTKPVEFKNLFLEAPLKHRGNNIRVTLDTKEDYLCLCAVFDNLYKSNHFFGIEDILMLKEIKPWIFEINSSSIQNKL